MTRLSCCVPFCNRTRRNDEGFDEWIRADHWRAVPRKDRAVYFRARRKAKKSGIWTAAARMWSRCRRIAIERAGGI